MKLNKFVNVGPMNTTAFTVAYCSEQVKSAIRDMPAAIRARYTVLIDRMEKFGPNLGEPHTKAFGEGLFELRIKSVEGIARVFDCTRIGRRIVVLHGFVKKSDKTPLRDRRLAEQRLKEIKNADA